MEQIVISKLKWTIDLIQKNHGAQVDLSDDLKINKLSIGFASDFDIQVSATFHEDLENRFYDHHHHMKAGPWISLQSGERDYLSSIFYLVNSIQEFDNTDGDKYGRFKYENSLQKKWGVTHRNLVWEYIQAFCEQYDIEYDKTPVNSYFLTHDVDFIYKGWKRESLNSFKKGNISEAVNVVSSKLSNNPIYANVEGISELEKKHGAKSNFFWITQKGSCRAGIENADYNMKDDLVNTMVEKATSNGCEHGLHKSTLDKSFKDELEILPNAVSSRYHYLKYTLPQAYDKIEKAGIKLDTSLGFAEYYGYRNSYGLPFRPYNLKEDRPYNFIEVPLMIMDTTMTDYMGLEQKDVYEKLSTWLEKVSTHSLVTILWHNPQLGKYSFKEMANCYESILKDMKNNKIKSLTISEILEKWGHDLPKTNNND